VKDVEREDRWRRFRLHLPGALREKLSAAAHSLDRAERVLDGASPDPHQARVGAAEED
jgi:hypothetical protein